MEEEIDPLSLPIRKPVENSFSIHQVHSLLGKQIERSNSKKGKDSTTNYLKFYTYCDKILGTRKGAKIEDQTQKLKTTQLLELFEGDNLKNKQRLKIGYQIQYLQNKIWDLDIQDITSIKDLIPAYRELFDKLRIFPDGNERQLKFQNIVIEVANDLAQSTR